MAKASLQITLLACILGLLGTVSSQDPTSMAFQQTISPSPKIVDGNIISKEGTINSDLFQDNVVVGYLFAADWCGHCRFFTPMLIDLYKKWNENGKRIEIIWLPYSNTEENWANYYSEMPWMSLPFNDPRIKLLEKKFSVRILPTLVIVNKDEQALSTMAHNDVFEVGEAAIDLWAALYDWD